MQTRLGQLVQHVTGRLPGAARAAAADGVYLALNDLAFASPITARATVSDFDVRRTKLTAETAHVALGVLR
ncbi:hypothetical protein [Streptomyces sp. MZ04]|uniref:hypothetical protein n=1 Tax=Streptomyces sp. MZ04 TaxID=2559236 RepID=UPI00107E8483|nr:hypothetical protein [Streptomyces sp. MZ04]TGB16097.1 hypothetical protein E2651_01300 [Streptomyces sp. MZ04]